MWTPEEVNLLRRLLLSVRFEAELWIRAKLVKDLSSKGVKLSEKVDYQKIKGVSKMMWQDKKQIGESQRTENHLRYSRE